jgi:hypothetical protein
MYFSNGSFYDQCYLSFSTTCCLSHTTSLCLSAESSPSFPFYIKCCPTILSVSLNKQIPLRTVLISKVTSMQNTAFLFVRLFLRLSVCIFVSFCQSLSLFDCICLYLSVSVHMYVSVCVTVSFCIFTYRSTCFFLYIYIYVCLSVCLFIHV